MDRNVKHVTTPYGEIAYTEKGEGPPAVFVHGVFLNGFLWRHVIDQVSDLRRCIAIDLLAHGETRPKPDTEMSFTAQAEMIASVFEALGLQTADVVSNDSGGGIAQIFAANYPERIRTLTLTNCDTHDNWPPAAFQPTMAAVKGGLLRKTGPVILANPAAGRQALGAGYERPDQVSDETILAYLEPIVRSTENIERLERFFSQMDPGETVAVEPKLRELSAPTLIVWGTGDVFFDVKWAHWLKDTIPGAREPVVAEGAKLFFPDERPELLVEPLRALWSDAA